MVPLTGVAVTEVMGLSNPFIPHISRTLRPRFRVGLLPFRSQLLRESLLISFPPLIYMLKFRG